MLQGLYFEAQGKNGEAEQLYKKELEKDAQNGIMLKRLVSTAGHGRAWVAMSCHSIA